MLSLDFYFLNRSPFGLKFFGIWSHDRSRDITNYLKYCQTQALMTISALFTRDSL